MFNLKNLKPNIMKGGELKMKKTLLLMITSLAVMMLTMNAYAYVPVAIDVTATITPGTPDMTVSVYRAPAGEMTQAAWDAGAVSAMNFDSWAVVSASDKAPQWVTKDQYVAFVNVTGMGNVYKIGAKNNGTVFLRTGGTETLPAGSFACTPVYSEKDGNKNKTTGVVTPQGPKPATAIIDNVSRPAIASGVRTVYTSENPGSSRIIQLWYGFPPYTESGADPYIGYAPIPTTQKAGTYKGVSVTIDFVP
jgi:hypothetical protein